MSLPAPVSISRYNGNKRMRVLQASNMDFLHGHWYGGRGHTFYDGTWYVQEDLSATADEWRAAESLTVGRRRLRSQRDDGVEGAERITSCGRYGSLLGELNAGAGGVRECEQDIHGPVPAWLCVRRVQAAAHRRGPVVQPATVRMYVNRLSGGLERHLRCRRFLRVTLRLGRWACGSAGPRVSYPGGSRGG
eukprot:750292-Hanusia_phi.AAC.1